MKQTNIQWCHSTVNPVMGCDGCELWPSIPRLTTAIAMALHQVMGGSLKALTVQVRKVVGDRDTSGIYMDREQIAERLFLGTDLISRRHQKDVINAIRRECKCYAGMLGTFRAGHKGYADAFGRPKLFPGRMADAANWGSPTDNETVHKPWIRGLRRLIFISDMGDALSSHVPFEYLESEIVENVSSPAGQRHLWLWLSKRPARMAAFGQWLASRNIWWPDNLVAMTTITSSRYAGRLAELKRVPSKLKGLSLEPLFEPVSLDLGGIDWVIVGGGSDACAASFDIEFALALQRQCKEQGVAFFLKQLGKMSYYANERLHLNDSHGGDWQEWPESWRVREFPDAFRNYAPEPLQQGPS